MEKSAAELYRCLILAQTELSFYGRNRRIRHDNVGRGSSSKRSGLRDSLSRLQWTFSGVKNSITGEMLPSITMIMDGLSDLMAGQDDAGEKIKQGVTGIISNISQMIPQILEVITNIAGAVLESAPLLCRHWRRAL